MSDSSAIESLALTCMQAFSRRRQSVDVGLPLRPKWLCVSAAPGQHHSDSTSIIILCCCCCLLQLLQLTYRAGLTGQSVLSLVSSVCVVCDCSVCSVTTCVGTRNAITLTNLTYYILRQQQRQRQRRRRSGAHRIATAVVHCLIVALI